MITIKEIAKQLNMSTTTVSNVIHGKAGEVSDDTKRKVEEFLKKVDYVPNINARNLAQNESKIIGLALKARADKYENLIMDPFVSVLIGGVEETIRNAGYFIALSFRIAADQRDNIRFVVCNQNLSHSAPPHRLFTIIIHEKCPFVKLLGSIFSICQP